MNTLCLANHNSGHGIELRSINIRIRLTLNANYYYKALFINTSVQCLFALQIQDVMNSFTKHLVDDKSISSVMYILLWLCVYYE